MSSSDINNMFFFLICNDLMHMLQEIGAPILQRFDRMIIKIVLKTLGIRGFKKFHARCLSLTGFAISYFIKKFLSNFVFLVF